nr:NAD-dependent epimerase/dehydratase family protein [Halapricum sp. CBA1109]
MVTGGAGFIGSHLCERLLEAGRSVICLDNCSSGRERNLDDVRADEAFTFLRADVRNDLTAVLRDGSVDPDDIDRIYHLASRASPADFEDHPLDIARTNSEGTQSVLELAATVDARVLYASTSEVYGDPEVHPQPESYNGNVDPRGTRACYDEGKRFGETITSVYHRQHGVDARTVRIFNTYGPRMRADDGRVIPTFITQALDGEDITVYGDGTQTRSFLYVSDLCRALRAVMAAPDLGGDVLNVGSTREVTINSLAETIRSLIDTDSEVTYHPLPDDDPQQRRPDISRIQVAIGWEPDVAFEDGLRRTIQSVRAQRD